MLYVTPARVGLPAITMTADRLEILSVSHVPASPPRFGAQARIHGLLRSLARRHEVTAVSLVDEEFDSAECERSMGEYCREVILVPNRNGSGGERAKRMLQLRSLASLHSFEHFRYSEPALQDALDRVLSRRRFDVVNLEFPYLGHFRFRQAPPGARPPSLVIDAHEIAYDIVRQFAGSGGIARRLYAGLDFRKLRREELRAFRTADGICTCSVADEQRVHAEVPSARTVVVPNAADVEFYQPRPSDPEPDGRTVVFFGLMSTFPNLDGILWFVREIWPRIAAERPQALLKIIGARPPRSVLDLAGPSVEVKGFVDDLRPHLASAAVLVVPLRLGGGTRLKIVEGMAMSKAIVSTRLGAEGIDAVDGRDILLADDPGVFAASVVRVLADQALASRLGRAARELAVGRYAWSAAAIALEQFYREILAG